MRTRRECVWAGVSLAALFLYPLASALEGDPYYLQWKPSHSVEAIAALVALWLGFSALLVLVRGLHGVVGALALGCITVVPVMSFAAGVSRQLPFREALIGAWQMPGIALACIATTALLVVGAVILQPDRLRRLLAGILLVVSPLSLIVLIQLGRPIVQRSAAPTAREVLRPPNTSCSPVLALLFDELSFAYVYEGREIRPDLPGLRGLAATATQHLAVVSPGPVTLVSLPGYLAARPVHNIEVSGSTVVEAREDGQRLPFDATAETGLFGQAQRLGFRTEMTGYYFSYCDLLGARVDSCRAFSFYNHATFDGGWSLMNPILTTLTLWPRQAPLGLLKNPAFARQQRRLVEHTTALARQPLERGSFRFVHFSIPHLPFVFDTSGYDPPRDPLRTTPDERYVEQIAFTDRVVDELMESLRRSGVFDGTTVVVLSDHGFRFGGRETNPRHVPFIVKDAGQHASSLVETREQGETLLPQVLRRACGL